MFFVCQVFLTYFILSFSVSAYAAFSCDTVTEIPKTECDSLVALYDSTNGGAWTNKTGWKQTNTPCSWFGILCGNGNVYSIDLSHPGSKIMVGNNLNGVIPENLNLPQLQTIYLIQNKLTGKIPNFNMPRLRELALEYNQLDGNIPNFNGLPILEKLNLDSNKLSGEIPNFDKLPMLRSLWIDSNQLTGKIPNFDRLPSLELLYLSSNQLSGSIPDFNGLQNLQVIYLGANNLSGNIPDFNLQKLEQLHLWKNKLTGNLPNFSKLPNLIKLSLGSNQLSGNIPSLEKLIKLTGIYLSDNYLSGKIPNFMAFSVSDIEIALNNNCGLFAYDITQENILNSKDSMWKVKNPSCPLSTFVVNIQKSGNGSGVVSGAGNSYKEGVTVSLTATPDTGSIFEGWSGDCSGTTPTIKITMDKPKSCTASFKLAPIQTALLSITKVGDGTISATGINCGTDCSESYSIGTSIALAATPSTGFNFVRWSGDCTGATPNLTIKMDAPKSCTATFSGRNKLSVQIQGNGSVSSQPTGISCGIDCEEDFAAGTSITLTANAQSSSTFSKWSGCDTSSGTQCTVSMTTAKNVTAIFTTNNVGEPDIVVDKQSLLFY